MIHREEPIQILQVHKQNIERIYSDKQTHVHAPITHRMRTEFS